MPVYKDLTELSKLTYKLGATPQTIVVSPEGKVIKNWMGAYSGDKAREVEEYFNVRLPGLTPSN